MLPGDVDSLLDTAPADIVIRITYRNTLYTLGKQTNQPPAHRTIDGPQQQTPGALPSGRCFRVRVTVSGPGCEEPSEAIPGDAVLRTDNKQQAPVPGGSTRPRSKVGRHCHSPLPSLRPAEVRSFFFEYYDAARPRPFARRRADQPPPESKRGLVVATTRRSPAGAGA